VYGQRFTLPAWFVTRHFTFRGIKDVESSIPLMAKSLKRRSLLSGFPRLVVGCARRKQEANGQFGFVLFVSNIVLDIQSDVILRAL
jgi:hypothetical protein